MVSGDRKGVFYWTLLLRELCGRTPPPRELCERTPLLREERELFFIIIRAVTLFYFIF